MERSEAIRVLKDCARFAPRYTKEYAALNYAINSLETDEKYQLEYEISTGKNKVVTTKQLEEMHEKFQKKLWHEHEDVMGNQMVEMGSAEQVLQDLLMELGCWDEEDSE